MSEFTFNKIIKIGSEKIGKGKPVFVIAEVGVNHNNNINLAYQLIGEAKKVKANAIKFQSFKADRLVTPDTPKVEYQKDKTSQKETHYEMIKRLEISKDFQRKLFNYCKKRKIIFLSTPYDIENAKFLNTSGVSAFKVASADITDIPLQEFIASTGKPVIVSTGMATLDEIKEVLEIYKEYKNPNLILLHCVSNYPASHKSLNLNVITTLRNTFDVLVGYSDHSVGNIAAIIATVLGSSVIEKHFTLDKTMTGPDHKASIEPQELKKLIEDIRLTELILGNGTKIIQPEEKSMRRISRKSLVANQVIKKGQIIKEAMLTLKRPGTGILPKYTKEVIGYKVIKDIKLDELISWDKISKNK